MIHARGAHCCDFWVLFSTRTFSATSARSSCARLALKFILRKLADDEEYLTAARTSLSSARRKARTDGQRAEPDQKLPCVTDANMSSAKSSIPGNSTAPSTKPGPTGTRCWWTNCSTKNG